MSQKKVSVLFVCLGNICRSPTADGVFSHKVREAGMEEFIHIDSAGTAAYHVGNPPDGRARQAAGRRGISLDHLRARQVAAEDFEHFDYILAMDHANHQDLLARCAPEHRERVSLFLDYAPRRDEQEVPDPYYGGVDGFEYVLDLVEEAAEGLLNAIRERHGL